MDYVIADAVINGLSKAITSSQIKIDKSLSEKMDFFMTRMIHGVVSRDISCLFFHRCQCLVKVFLW